MEDANFFMGFLSFINNNVTLQASGRGVQPHFRLRGFHKVSREGEGRRPKIPTGFLDTVERKMA
jgi:hypothetical protein